MEANEADLAAIREGAYFRWLAAGAPPGDGVEYWLGAESEYVPIRDADRPTSGARRGADDGRMPRLPSRRADREELIGSRG